MDPTIIKGIHLVGAFSWFAALLYGVRMLVYIAEAKTRPESERRVISEQLNLMSRRLWLGIGTPAAVLTFFFGIALASKTNAWPHLWFQLKFVAITILLVYHSITLFWVLRPSHLPGGGFLRIWNELGTLLLIFIVFSATTRSPTTALWSVAVFLGFAAVIFSGLKLRRLSDTDAVD